MINKEYIPHFIKFAISKVLSILEQRGIIPRFPRIRHCKTFETGYKNGTLLCYLVVMSSLLMYSLPFNETWAYHVRLALIFCVFLLLVLRTLPKLFFLLSHQKECPPRILRSILLFAIAAIAGLLFLGNMFTPNHLSRIFLNFIGKMFGETSLHTLTEGDNQGTRVEISTLSIGDYREMGTFNEYCHGLLPFSSYFGGILVFILIVNYLFKTADHHHLKLTEFDASLYEIFLLCAGSLPFLFFFMDFLAFGTRAWVKSRFLEIPVTIIIFTFLYFVQRAGNKITQFIVGALLIIYIVVPVIGSNRPSQWQHNLRIFNELLYKAK